MADAFKGFARIPMYAFESEFFKEDVKRYGGGKMLNSLALFDLCRMQYFTARTQEVRIGRKTVEVVLDSGEFIATNSFLEERFKWDNKRVIRFINALLSEGILLRRMERKDGAKVFIYRFNFENGRHRKTPPQTEKETPPQNTRINKGIQTDLFEETPPQTERKTPPQNATQYKIYKDKYICSPEFVQDSFNSICTSLPKLKLLTRKRLEPVEARLKEMKQTPETYMAYLKQVFESVEASDFLTNRRGENRNGWKANFDWIFLPRNFAKIIEGNYDNTNSANLLDSSKEPENWQRYFIMTYTDPIPESWADVPENKKITILKQINK